jgi:UDP-N-acetylglucosamine--dolichyl-phosphate N-acetylglucosaminephosphotransferase
VSLIGTFAAMALFLAPFSYLAFVHYPLDADLRRSILICGAISLVGFFVVLRLVPVAARYLLRRGMFGKDINKKGLLMGEIKV